MVSPLVQFVQISFILHLHMFVLSSLWTDQCRVLAFPFLSSVPRGWFSTAAKVIAVFLITPAVLLVELSVGVLRMWLKAQVICGGLLCRSPGVMQGEPLWCGGAGISHLGEWGGDRPGLSREIYFSPRLSPSLFLKEHHNSVCRLGIFFLCRFIACLPFRLRGLE